MKTEQQQADPSLHFTFDSTKDCGCFSTWDWFSVIRYGGARYATFNGRTEDEVLTRADEVVARLNSHHHLVADRAELVDVLVEVEFDSRYPDGKIGSGTLGRIKAILTRMEATLKQEQQ